jgi:hypothetical protein
MTFGGLALDTSTYEHYRFAFDKGLLLGLEQFLSIPPTLLVSEVVRNEIVLHLKKELSDAKSKACRALRLSRELVDDLAFAVAEKALDLDSIDTVGRAEQLIEQHLANTGAEVVAVENNTVDIAKVLSRYFSAEPPFSDQKKNEFPDAFALLSLESWAVENGTKVLIVSDDPDWKAFCESSSHLEYDPELSSAIAKFQKPDPDITQVVKSLFEDGSTVTDAIEAALKKALEGFDGEVEVSLSDYCEIETPELTLVDFKIEQDAHGNPMLKFVQVDENAVGVSLLAHAQIHVSLSYTFYLWDSVDREEIPLRSQASEWSENWSSEILVTYERSGSDVVDDSPDIEILELPHIDAGNLELSLAGDE